MIHRSISFSHAVRPRGKQIAGFLLLFLALAGTANAANGGAGLPWEQPLTTLSNSVTGPIAYSVSLLGIVCCGAVLIFAGGQINEFVRGVLFCVLVIAFIVAAKNTLTAFGFAAGAEITESQNIAPQSAALSPGLASNLHMKPGQKFIVRSASGAITTLVYAD